MLYPALENCVKNAGCKYTLATMLGRRMKDLMYKNPGAAAGNGKKELTFALEEIESGRVVPAGLAGHNTKA
jgi:DNA-directed RNA polymerase subunit K/omega